MTEPAPHPLFSIIIPTRNRPALFATALRSVLTQAFDRFEIIIVDDGSSEENTAAYAETIDQAGPRVRRLNLVRTARGHGQSYALNFGVAHAAGEYVGFLDDDDEWIDTGHLARAASVIDTADSKAELVLANQRGYRGGMPVADVIWIESLERRLNRAADPTGAYTVTPVELLACQSHCHLNTTLVRRDFYDSVGGLDEGLRYECDRDFFLRAIDKADRIMFLPQIVSRHNIPNPATRASMSTSESELSKRLYQLRVFDKAVLFSSRDEIIRYALRQRGYTLGHIGAEAKRSRLGIAATCYKQESQIVRFVSVLQSFRSRQG